MTTMETRHSTTKIRVESAEAVLGLHWFVGVEEGLFEEEGLDVEILLPGVRETRFDWDDPRARDHHLVRSTNYQDLFERKQADVYRACEWGQIRRAYDNPAGPIVSRRAAVVCQGVYVPPDSPINGPAELAGRTVGVQFHQGSHYSTLSMLEGFFTPEELTESVVHAGTVRERYEAMMSGEIDAATLMEPWISLAEKKGAKKLIETHYFGVENAAADMDPEILAALNRGIKRAVKLINADKRKYVRHMIDEMPEEYARQLSADDFYLPRLRYVDPVPYSQEQFQRAFDFMVRYDLVGADADYSKLVCNTMI